MVSFQPARLTTSAKRHAIWCQTVTNAAALMARFLNPTKRIVNKVTTFIIA